MNMLNLVYLIHAKAEVCRALSFQQLRASTGCQATTPRQKTVQHITFIKQQIVFDLYGLNKQDIHF